MGMLVAPYRHSNSGGSVAVGSGALVYRTSTTGLGASATPFLYPSEEYDNASWHDTASNTGRMTVPSGPSLIRLAGQAGIGASRAPVGFRKNAASFPGRAYQDKINSVDQTLSLKSPPIAVSAADYFELYKETTSNPSLNALYNWYGVEVLDPSLRYCLVKKTTNQGPIAVTTATALSFDSEIADVGGWHDNVTNNSRLTVPSGVSRVRVTGGVKNNGSVTGEMFATIRKNGVFTATGIASGLSKDTTKGLNFASAVMAVTPGDYFEIEVFLTTNTDTVPAADEVWFCIEEIPSTYSCALVNRSSTFNVVGGAGWRVVDWNSEVYDDASIHDNVTNPSRLTVPSGKTKARASFSIIGTTTELRCEVLKNGAQAWGIPADFSAGTTAAGRANGVGTWVDVTPGDYFHLEIWGASGHNIVADALNWFCLETR